MNGALSNKEGGGAVWKGQEAPIEGIEVNKVKEIGRKEDRCSGGW